VEITEVRIRLVRSPDERLKAFATVTFERAFVVRDIKVVDGPSGLFIAMPSRKLVSRCPRCGEKNHLRAKYCNGCGSRLGVTRARPGGGPGSPGDGANGRQRVRLHVDIAHPIHAKCREEIQKAVLEAYEREAARAPHRRERERAAGTDGTTARREHADAPARAAVPESAPPPELPAADDPLDAEIEEVPVDGSDAVPGGASPWDDGNPA